MATQQVTDLDTQIKAAVALIVSMSAKIDDLKTQITTLQGQVTNGSIPADDMNTITSDISVLTNAIAAGSSKLS